MCVCDVAGEVKVDNDWPSAGEIVFNNVSIRYSGNACPVARNLDIHIQPGEKVYTASLCILGVHFATAAEDGFILVKYNGC